MGGAPTTAALLILMMAMQLLLDLPKLLLLFLPAPGAPT
jgi:hypothetical protein